MERFRPTHSKNGDAFLKFSVWNRPVATLRYGGYDSEIGKNIRPIKCLNADTVTIAMC